MKIVLVTGMSGSGKSVALNVLEDSGFFCIDNLPVNFLEQAVRDLHAQGQTQLAVAADARTVGTLRDLAQILQRLQESGHVIRAVFLNARDEILLQRYSETRRRHPLSLRPADGQLGEQAVQTLADCIRRERDILSEVVHLGASIDTSDLQPQVLRRWLRETLELESAPLTLLFQSFAFKEGVPLDADLVFDVRCLPNPYYAPELKPLTGRDGPVVAFLDAEPAAAEMIADITTYLRKWLPRHAEENRSYLTVAIGCTGGQHRSVYCAEKLRENFRNDFSCAVRHRSLAQKGKA